MKKSYIINLKFGTWRNQIWLSGESENINSFKDAKMALNSISENCTNSNDFLEKVSVHFEKSGFFRIYK